MGQLLVSYKPHDSKDSALTLISELEHKFGEKSVIRGVNAALFPGDDLVETVPQIVDKAVLLLVVIGPNWVTDDWLTDEHDADRLALRHALGANKRVIPVLVNGAALPSKSALPEPIQPLVRRSPVVLNGDVTATKDLIAMLERLMESQPPAPPLPAAPPIPTNVAAVTASPVPSAIVPVAPSPVTYTPSPVAPNYQPQMPVYTPNTFKYVDPKARARIHSTSKWVSVYDAPNFQANVICEAKNKKRYPAIGHTEDNQWWQVLVDGIPGWVSGTSITLSKHEAVPKTRISEGGILSAQEVYFRYVLQERRDKVKNRGCLARMFFWFGEEFVTNTAWSEKMAFPIRPDQKDPEFMRMAEGGVGMLERKIMRKTRRYKTLKLLFIFLAIATFFGGFYYSVKASSIDPYDYNCSYGYSYDCSPYQAAKQDVRNKSTTLFLAFFGALAVWNGFWIVQRAGFLHGKYRTRQQLIQANRELLTGLATAGAAAAAIGGVAYAQKRSKDGKPVDYGKLIEHVGTGLGAAGLGAAALGGANKLLNRETEVSPITTAKMSVVDLHTFISYRRADSGPKTDIVGAMYDFLSQQLGAKSIFRDKEEIPYGRDFVAFLEQTLFRCHVVVAYIGPKWLSLLQERLNSSEIDFVRVELAKALEWQIPIIPVLPKGVDMPPVHLLPSDLQPLVRYNAVMLKVNADNFKNDQTFIKDIEDLGNRIEQIVAGRLGFDA